MIDTIPAPDVKARLIAAAEEVFAEKGFKAATIREIAEKATANIAAINYHFGDKERLYIEACKHAHACSAFPPGPPVWPVGMPATQKLTLYIEGMVKGMTAPASPTSLQLIMREMASPTAAAREIVRDSIQPMAFALRDILWELFPRANEHRLRMVGFSVMGQCLFYRQNRAIAGLIFGEGTMDALPTVEVAAHIVRFTLAGLGHGEGVTPAILEAPL